MSSTSTPNHPASPTIDSTRPNTGVCDHLLSSGNVILCCGEDHAELNEALHPLVGALPSCVHHYRGYNFAQYEHFTLVSAGIGTGCLEPLLYEILGLTQKIILIGTAGLIAGTPDKLGRVYAVGEAYLAGSAVQLRDGELPLRPTIPTATSSLEAAVSVSSDHYYSFGVANDPRKLKAQAANQSLVRAMRKYFKAGRLIDMEIGQFYHFCSVYGSEGLEYLAIKGIANSAENFSEQMHNSRTVLQGAAREALRLLMN